MNISRATTSTNPRWTGLRQLLRRMDISMLLIILGLCMIGVFFIFSAGYENEDSYNRSMYLKQLAWIVVGFSIYLAVSLIDYERLCEFSYWLFGLAIVLLLLVFVIGKTLNGAQRWIPLGFFDLQPSEVAKAALILTLSWYLSRPGTNLRSGATLFISVGIMLLPLTLILAQPDLGTSLTLIPITFCILFVCRLPFRVIGLLLLVTPLIMAVAWFFLLEEYQTERILVFLNPERDPLNAGWSAIQSKIAVASGGFSGKGYLAGTQNFLGFLPRNVAPTDFIYCVIAEELGFKGSVVVLGLYLFLLFGIMRASLTARDELGRLICVGVMAMIFMHVYVNIGMTVGLAPITGLPLPFLSYGGSVMVGSMIALGLVQSIYMRRQKRPTGDIL